MRGGEGRRQPAVEQSASNRKLSPVVQRRHLNSKKRRLKSENETLTPTPNIGRIPPRTNYFKSNNSSSRTHHEHKRQRRRKFSRSDGYRKWVQSTRDLSIFKDKVIFVSYNILGVENASKHPDLYSNVPHKFLDWDHRKKLLCKEISQHNASIMCFQEVDRFDDLYDLLQEDGFRGVYQARTGEACDGCAIFWKKEQFTLLHQENIDFQRFRLRNNVAQLCVLKMNQDKSNSSTATQASQGGPSRILLVGNIHVLFNPNRGDIKLGQIRLFIEKAHELSQEWGNIPVVLAGDLNSLPRSAVYQFLASSELDLQLHDRRKMSGQICPLEFQAFQSQNNYAASAYLGVHGSCRTRDNYGEPLATSYHSKFMGTVDYIWHTEDLVPVRVLDTLPVDILRKTGGLPSKNWGSDHLALVCELAFADNGHGT